ncbi:segregation/condensation protein A [Clostridium sp. 'White wine YQ']|uniref:segregation/condensation protein A n=1 Tax=Clostridium sp. 'White wine YQ' TaxID=3027474 RepID=UPI0023664AFA|nr:segregation/condensation protein A [Clostridium sp. 'White wine YQ']MDD7793881.1 segregation/condensation protein A [Clostridium sp. 'White wine YQ']
MEALKVKIADFEGPFDLLLHLIRKNKMDIYDIKIFEITNQYLEHLQSMKEMDLEITSEFIVIAATLIEIKSKMLLPKAKDENDDDQDPKLSLVEKLVQYRKFKAAAEYLREKSLYTGIVFSKKPEIIPEEKSDVSNEDILKNVTMLSLYKIYNELMERVRNRRNDVSDSNMSKTVQLDRYRMEDKMIDLTNYILEGKTYSFDDLISSSECKMETVVTFLALLELIKEKVINVFQTGSFGEILIKRRMDNE